MFLKRMTTDFQDLGLHLKTYFETGADGTIWARLKLSFEIREDFEVCMRNVLEKYFGNTPRNSCWIAPPLSKITDLEFRLSENEIQSGVLRDVWVTGQGWTLAGGLSTQRFRYTFSYLRRGDTVSTKRFICLWSRNDENESL